MKFDIKKKRKVKTILMEHFNGIPFQKSRPANKEHTNQPNIPGLIKIFWDAVLV